MKHILISNISLHVQVLGSDTEKPSITVAGSVDRARLTEGNTHLWKAFTE